MKETIELKCVGYHGTTTDKIESIQKNGYLMSSDKEWFGRGVYFFGDLKQLSISGRREAKNWVLYVKQKQNWVIFRAKIVSKKYFDMLDEKDRITFNEIKKELLTKHNSLGFSIKDFKDRVIFELLQKENFFEVIRVFVDAAKKDYINYGYVVMHPQVQICVKVLQAIQNNTLESQRSSNVNEI